MLVAAAGVAISPIGIVPVVLLLASARGRVNGPAFLAGWVAGIAVAGSILLVLASDAGASESGEPRGWVSWLKLGLGTTLLVLAVKQWRGRPRGVDEPSAPAWLGAVDSFSPAKAAGAGVVLAAVNPKNLLLVAAGMAAIAETGIPAGEQAAALVVFTLVASLGVATPVAVSLALGERSREPLGRLNEWMTRNGPAIMAVILLLIGVKLVGDGVAELAG